MPDTKITGTMTAGGIIITTTMIMTTGEAAKEGITGGGTTGEMTAEGMTEGETISKKGRATETDLVTFFWNKSSSLYIAKEELLQFISDKIEDYKKHLINKQRQAQL